MKVVIQRVTQSNVKVNNNIVGQIKNGMLLLVGVTHVDTSEDVDYLVRKVVYMWIFEDDNGKMKTSLLQKGYDILTISQFTLAIGVKIGNWPSFIEAARPKHAKLIYDELNNKLREEKIRVETGSLITILFCFKCIFSPTMSKKPVILQDFLQLLLKFIM